MIRQSQSSSKFMKRRETEEICYKIWEKSSNFLKEMEEATDL